MSDDTTTTTDEARRTELLRRLQSGTRDRVRAVQLARDGDRIRRRLELEEWLVMNSVSIADMLDELAKLRGAMLTCREALAKIADYSPRSYESRIACEATAAIVLSTARDVPGQPQPQALADEQEKP